MYLFITLFILQLCTSAFAQTYLNITAITACPRRKSILECWRLTNPFTQSGDAGTRGSAVQKLGSIGGDASYLILPAGFSGGVHNAPTYQYVAFLSGVAHITLPNKPRNSFNEAWIHGGPRGLIIAADTAEVSTTGHITNYPGETETTAIQIPFAYSSEDNAYVIPEHIVLHKGPCTPEEQQI